jgi:predicted aconitase with swiveling domain
MDERPGGPAVHMGRALAPGIAEGPVVALDAPLSFWGGMNAATGEIVDRRHPQAGARVTGCILLMPSGRGSSSSSSVLAESIRAGSGPAGVLLGEPDPIIALGAIVAGELYGRRVPVVVLDRAALAAASREHRLTVVADAGGGARITPVSSAP